MTSVSLWNYHRDYVNDNANENNASGNYHRTNNNKTRTSKSFKHKTKIIGKTSINNNTLKTKLVAPLKYLSKIWRPLVLPLTNYEIELDLS